MRSLGTRRAALATGVATLAAVALAGCSAGQVAETAIKKPSVYGVNSESSDSAVSIRNLAVAYPNVTGYPAGGDAPLQVGLYNQTRQAITVLVSSRPAEGTTEKNAVVSARSVGLAGGSATTSAPTTAIPEPSGNRPSAPPDDNKTNTQIPDPSGNPSPGETPSTQPTPAGAAVRPARIELGPLGAKTFLPEDAEKLVATGLTGKLLPGQSINLVFEFSNGADPLVLRAPVAIPLSPASRAPGIPPEENLGGDQDSNEGEVE